MMIKFDSNVCSNLQEASSREWLETNGIGGFASSTISGIHTRRYHGLLTASLKPPVSRFVLLSRMEETLVVRGRRYDLSANRYPGVIHPQGFVFLKEFRLDPFPVFSYDVDGIEIRKSVFMIYGENSTVIDYQFQSEHPECTLELRPFFAYRDYHSLAHENSWFNGAFLTAPGCVTIQPYQDLPPMRLAQHADRVEATGHWYRNFEYTIEQERGLDFREDLFNPFVLMFDLSTRRRVSLIASLEIREAEQTAAYKAAEEARREQLCATAEPGSFEALLTAACDQFIVWRGNHKTIIAGYPWFTDWGRDTMIALPGLTLTTGRFEIARDILQSFAAHVNKGMLPNRFPDGGEVPEYNTVDGTLWFFEAIRSYGEKTNDYATVREQFYAVLKDIVDWHVKGTRYGIRVDGDGLLNAGSSSTQLTWMDVKIGDWAVTPRFGKAVEIQALWYNALRVMQELSKRFGDKEACIQYTQMAHKTKAGFNSTFWNERGGYLYDVVNDEIRDERVRPNQILAVSLSHGMLPVGKERKIVATVQKHLLTPYGLRTLAPHDPDFRSHYEGDGPTRDSAYHQGTVWPWLMGPFLSAYIKVNRGSAESIDQARLWLEPLQQHLLEAGLGQVSEIFDANPPHTPRGCPAQAWSTGELLRVISEHNLFGSSSVASLL